MGHPEFFNPEAAGVKSIEGRHGAGINSRPGLRYDPGKRDHSDGRGFFAYLLIICGVTLSVTLKA